VRRSFVRAVVVAGVLLLALGPAIGVAPSAAALSQDDTAATASLTGYDISWPQCGGPYPPTPAFGIVGVNAGIVFSPNPCLASELVWAGGANAQLYANTGNPGPALSRHWPVGQTSPTFCDPADPDTAACAYDYGYNAAADSYAGAVAAFSALGLAGSPAGNPWWLDVETANSWRSDVSLNVAALRGATAYLVSVGVATIGFYSTQYQWDVITGGTGAFAAHPSWVAGASDLQGASAGCAGPGFTGGDVVLAQYPSGGFDADLRCTSAPAVLTAIAVSPASASVEAGGTQAFAAAGYDQYGRLLSPQPAFAWSVDASAGSITQSGVFTAGSTAGGPFVVTVSSGGVSGTADVTVTPRPDFSLSVSPASQSITRGGTATYLVTIVPSGGFTGSVAFSLTGRPSGSKVTFAPNSGTTTSTLTVKTSRSAKTGTVTLTIIGTSGLVTRSATASLTIGK
jgi:hypothetical protein